MYMTGSYTKKVHASRQHIIRSCIHNNFMTKLKTRFHLMLIDTLSTLTSHISRLISYIGKLKS